MFDYKKSDYFWGIIMTILLLYLFTLHIAFFIITQIIISVCVLIFTAHNHIEYDCSYITTPKYIKYPIFFILNPIAILGIIILGVIWLIKNPIKKFNNWLDTERIKKMKFKEFTKNN